MSFGDLMSSGRGPGVIGFLVALLILLGFGGLFFLVFDSEMQGNGVPIEAVIREQQKDIDESIHQLGSHKKLLNEAPRLVGIQTKLDAVSRENRSRAAVLSSMRETSKKLKNGLPEIQLALEKYKDEYRGFMRSKAVGEQIDELVCRSGATYQKVEIREVTPVGLQIRHADGQKRIPFEDLAADWHERFQFDPKQKEKAIALEEAMRNQHEAAIVVAEASRSKEQAAEDELRKTERQEQLEKAIASKEFQLREVNKEIRSLNSQLSRAEGDATNARRLGRSSINRSGEFKAQLQAKQSAARALQGEISSLKSQL